LDADVAVEHCSTARMMFGVNLVAWFSFLEDLMVLRRIVPSRVARSARRAQEGDGIDLD